MKTIDEIKEFLIEQRKRVELISPSKVDIFPGCKYRSPEGMDRQIALKQNKSEPFSIFYLIYTKLDGEFPEFSIEGQWFDNGIDLNPIDNPKKMAV